MEQVRKAWEEATVESGACKKEQGTPFKEFWWSSNELWMPLMQLRRPKRSLRVFESPGTKLRGIGGSY